MQIASDLIETKLATLPSVDIRNPCVQSMGAWWRQTFLGNNHQRAGIYTCRYLEFSCNKSGTELSKVTLLYTLVSCDITLQNLQLNVLYTCPSQ